MGVADRRIQRGNVKQEEPEELLNPWQEAGSRGLDTWFELPAVYAIPDGPCSHPLEVMIAYR